MRLKKYSKVLLKVEKDMMWMKEPRVRITNLSSYVQDKHQQTAHLRLISDDDCSCGN